MAEEERRDGVGVGDGDGEEIGSYLEPLFWSVTALDEPTLRECAIIQQVFDELALDGGQLSAPARRQDNHNHHRSPSSPASPPSSQLAYGEILCEPFAELLLRRVWPLWQRSHPDVGYFQSSWKTFVDLGSGLGKAVWVATRIPGGFTRALGIELLPPLHEAAMVAYSRLCKEEEGGAVELVNGDFLETDEWCMADVVFCCCITFERCLMECIAERATSLLQPGSIFLTVGQPLPRPPSSLQSSTPAWALEEKAECDFSWASCTVYIQSKQV